MACYKMGKRIVNNSQAVLAGHWENQMKLTSYIATLCLTIIAAVGSSNAWAEVCPSTDYNLTSPAEVDALGATGCDAISGGLRISGTDITSLNSLSGLTSVGGNLNIDNNHLLTDLDGLSGITSVGGELFISFTSVLTNCYDLRELALHTDAICYQCYTGQY